MWLRDILFSPHLTHVYVSVMQSDDVSYESPSLALLEVVRVSLQVIWGVIRNSFCSFKAK